MNEDLTKHVVDEEKLDKIVGGMSKFEHKIALRDYWTTLVNGTEGKDDKWLEQQFQEFYEDYKRRNKADDLPSSFGWIFSLF